MNNDVYKNFINDSTMNNLLGQELIRDTLLPEILGKKLTKSLIGQVNILPATIAWQPTKIWKPSFNSSSLGH